MYSCDPILIVWCKGDDFDIDTLFWGIFFFLFSAQEESLGRDGMGAHTLHTFSIRNVISRSRVCL